MRTRKRIIISIPMITILIKLVAKGWFTNRIQLMQQQATNMSNVRNSEHITSSKKNKNQQQTKKRATSQTTRTRTKKRIIISIPMIIVLIKLEVGLRTGFN